MSIRHFQRQGLALLLLACSLSAQAAPRIEMPAVDVAAVLAADALKPGPQPYRFAVPVAISVSPASAGEWQQLADGTAVWRLVVHSAGAASLNFGFTRFALPMGASLSVSAADGRDRHGPYTADHHGSGQLWTPVVRSDEALIELRVPQSARGQVDLALGSVNHGFRGFGAKDAYAPKSGSCNIDVVCSDGDDWRREIRSVARFTIGGALLCTGQLMNNSAQDFTPYFLTANHCVTTAAQAPTTAFYWNYQASRCGGAADGSLAETQTGALLVAASNGFTDAGSDFTLLQLLAVPDAAFKVYYAGWDRRDLAPVGVTGIHHPSGDEKRISKDFDQTFIAAYTEEPDSPRTALQPTHILVRSWDRGVTEGGSSGSGIWNAEHRLVGQLSGGGSSCESPKEPDWYGRMYMNFSQLDAPLTSVRTWLDPTASGVTVLDGADPAKGSSTPTPAPAPGGSTGGGSGGAATPLPGSGAPPGNGGSASAGDSGGGGALAAVWLLTAAALWRRRMSIDPARKSLKHQPGFSTRS